MNESSVRDAVERGGSIRNAAKLLGKPLTSVQWWLKRNKFRVVKRATIEKIADKNAS